MKPHSLEQLVAMLKPYVHHVAIGRAVRRKAKFGVTHWLTLDGRILAPYQMTNEHMINIIRMVARGKTISRHLLSQALDALSYASTAPDGAADAASQAADELMTAGFEARVRLAVKLSPLIRSMAELLARRGFNPFEDHGPQPLTDYTGKPTLSRDVAAQLQKSLIEGTFRVKPVPRAIEDTAPSIYDEGIGT